ncbi:MAG: hypothetical protein JEZ06_03675 [Anaerolineaceae bacterium]|nr:hypothetical protein [Anaerolineaceae bacterium]
MDGQVDRIMATDDYFSEPAYLSAHAITVPKGVQFLQWVMKEKHFSTDEEIPLVLKKAIETINRAVK